MKFFKTTYQDCVDEVTGHLQYQLEFLKTFELDSYDDESISRQLNTFYEEIKTNTTLIQMIEEEKRGICDDNSEMVYVLFSWDKLHRVAELMTTSL